MEQSVKLRIWQQPTEGKTVRPWVVTDEDHGAEATFDTWGQAVFYATGPTAPLVHVLQHRYLEVILANTSEVPGEWDALRAVAFCNVGIHGAWGEYLEMAAHLGLLPLDEPERWRAEEVLQESFKRFQSHLREMFYARPWVDAEYGPDASEAPSGSGGRLLCADCGELAYYDARVEDYRHCDPYHTCWLISGTDAD